MHSGFDANSPPNLCQNTVGVAIGVLNSPALEPRHSALHEIGPGSHTPNSVGIAVRMTRVPAALLA